MKISQGKSIFQFFAKSDIVKIAVVIVLVFTITNFLKVSILISGSKDISIYNAMHQALSVPGSFSNWLKQPWSIITFMFSSEEFLSLLFDLIWLWIFGSVIEDLKGPYRILPIYLLGGIFGGLAFMLSGMYSSTSSYYYLGVLPSLIAVVTATLIYNPKYAYWFYSVRIPIWVLGIFFFLMKVGTLSVYSISSMALILGGVLTGVLYNFGGIFLFDGLTNLFKKITLLGSNENFIKSSNKTNQKVSRKAMSDNATLDAILDKINQKGIQSLSTEERKILESFSKD